MIRSILLVLFSLVGLAGSAQTAQSIFEWDANSVTTKDIFRPLTGDSYAAPRSSRSKLYVLHSYTVKSSQGEAYTIKINSLNDARKDREDYDGFSILYNGKNILTYYTGGPLYNCGNITLWKNQSRFLQIPLDNKSFALCFGGWIFDQDEAPELVVVVVSDGKAQVVFDNYAFAYKYTPAPKFSIEFVDDWSGIGEDPDIYKKPSFLLGRTKHKIWREGNVLKYDTPKYLPFSRECVLLPHFSRCNGGFRLENSGCPSEKKRIACTILHISAQCRANTVQAPCKIKDTWLP